LSILASWKWTIPGLVGLAAIASAASLPVAAPISSVSRRLLGIDDRIASREAVALTFDDGPHALATPLLLDLLSERNVKATFFLVGEQVEKRPSLAAEIRARGHGIGIHGYRHKTTALLSQAELRDDLDRATRVIASAVGEESLLYRPPRGVFSYTALGSVRGRGWSPILWRVDGRDWRTGATAGSIVSRIGKRLDGGDIVLLHDSDYYSSAGSWRDTLAAVPLLLDLISSRGLEPIPIIRWASCDLSY
jgi:peptidoglycan-N-acetylglucosamine deacetylase